VRPVKSGTAWRTRLLPRRKRQLRAGRGNAARDLAADEVVTIPDRRENAATSVARSRGDGLAGGCRRRRSEGSRRRTDAGRTSVGHPAAAATSGPRRPAGPGPGAGGPTCSSSSPSAGVAAIGAGLPWLADLRRGWFERKITDAEDGWDRNRLARSTAPASFVRGLGSWSASRRRKRRTKSRLTAEDDDNEVVIFSNANGQFEMGRPPAGSRAQEQAFNRLGRAAARSRYRARLLTWVAGRWTGARDAGRRSGHDPMSASRAR